ncbi:hypothetical protein H1Z61_05825 [Bacillus aquiflavi]|uniref:Uncharacterized protein n=1 Tax=Bacillus aquiflavi TaxID=2672567 RepID=A0A6B3VVM8_9BACI|nr:hypothetical protein [Bacillus aquiflavi]MBA4536674.1 hypothetical protein [Bacillus aquiflavi]NEY81042.1 hypothetical protein [Bacillus aquiflavi]UAC47887.1 hypothetical protein K6959_14985 [Bacillus aquiflavi]
MEKYDFMFYTLIQKLCLDGGNKVKKFILILMLLSLFMIGCQQSNERWFDSYEKAVNEGIKQTGITKQDIIAETEVDNEYFVIYSIPNEDGYAIGVSNIAKLNGKYSWYPVGSRVDLVIKNLNPIIRYQ